ncbi:hypothetical protein GCM10023143_24680 [Compostibacter hankyongensis]|uniref:Uncharacterized protein n=1 Tax=Compostibacter hankyongensis TaxID=1007089 RepID=A0ABP8FZ72_9BACT
MLLVVLSGYLNRKKGVQPEHGLSVSFRGMRDALVKGLIIHTPLIVLAVTGVITTQQAAYPAALLTFGVGLWYLKRADEKIPFYRSDIFYAALLTAAMTWIMYYFA